MVRKVSILLPALNEVGPIVKVLAGLSELAKEREGREIYEFIVIDDGSTDGTGDAARAAGARVVRHPYNIGNGAAVKSGIRAAGGDVVLLMDSDGQHVPADVPRLLEHIDEHAMVVGARRKGSQAGLHRALANALYNRLATYVTGRKIPDLTSGFRAIRADVARRFLYLLPNAFSYPTTLTLACFKTGLPVSFVPIDVKKREGKSKIKLIKDGTRFLLIILKIATFFSPLRIFLPLSVMSFVLGLGYYGYTYATAHRFTNMSMLLIVQAVILFALALISEQIAQLRFDRSETQVRS
ncbi:MAG: glycosyltransferase family 2 protein [Planctomycetota bacterium]